ncbi:MAG: GTP 3',8-cyclase MoaA [Desulfatibacillaceae bacterium]|nr:GTP 3',8-cyclase MoaA [Desulfatibacillaceae bacterium]
MVCAARKDANGRSINYLRVSVTDRCNLRCFYCTPVHGLNLIPHKEILTYEEILAVVEAGLNLGITKVRVTGGEPLMRRGLVGFIEKLARLDGISEVALTTNGVNLSQVAHELKAAGLSRINVSLDSLTKQSFARITGLDALDRVLEGIKVAQQAGFEPIKINTVVIGGSNEEQVEDFARMTIDSPLEVRFIEFMPVGDKISWNAGRVISAAWIKERIEKRFGPLTPLQGRRPQDGPAIRFAIAGAKGVIGFINAMSGHTCADCNRLRLTSDGRIRPCLFSDMELDVKSLLRQGAGREQIVALMEQAIAKKPASRTQAPCRRPMSAIGG